MSMLDIGGDERHPVGGWMQENRLRSGSLSFVEVLAAALALVGLSMTPVLIAPYMFGAAGNASLFSTAMWRTAELT